MHLAANQMVATASYLDTTQLLEFGFFITCIFLPKKVVNFLGFVLYPAIMVANH